MPIDFTTRNNTIDEWRIRTNQSANALNTLETGDYTKTSGTLFVNGASKIVITSTGTPLEVANAALIGTTLTVGNTITLGTVTGRGNITAGGTGTFLGNLIASGVGNSLVVANSATIAKNVTVTGNATVGNITSLGVANSQSLNVVTSGAIGTTLSIGTSATVGTTLSVTGNTTVGNLNTSGVANSQTLRVVDSGSIGTSLGIGTSATVGTTLSVTGNTTVGNLNTSGVANSRTLNVVTSGAIGTSLGIGTSASIGTSLSVGTFATVGTTLNVTGNTTVGNLNTSGVANSETLNVVTSGAIGTSLIVGTFANVGTNLTVSQRANVGSINSLGVANSQSLNVVTFGTIGTTLTVNGSANVGSLNSLGLANSQSLNVVTSGAIGTTLSVNGNTTVGNLNTSGVVNTANLIVVSNASFGNITTSGVANSQTLNVVTSGAIGTTLSVTGNTTVGNLNTSGVANSETLRVNTSASIGTTLSVTGNATVANITSLGVANSQTLNVVTSGAIGTSLSIGTSATVGTTLTVEGNGLFKSDLSVLGDFEVTGDFVIAGNTVYDADSLILSAVTPILANATIGVYRGPDSLNAEIQWSNTAGEWRIRDVNNANGYSKILTANLISSAISSTNSDTFPSSAVANTINNRINNLNTSQVAENSGFIYLTAARVRANVSATTPISYDSGTGVFSHATSGVTAATYANNTHIPVITVNATGHVTGITNTIIRSATTSQSGIVRLEDSVTSTSTSNAATPNSVKSAYDLAATKFNTTGGTISGDMTVTGNLTVSGLTTYANTQTLLIGDNILTLNADLPIDVAPSENAGIEVNRGSQTNVYVRWDETADAWVAFNAIGEYRIANTTTHLTEGTNLYFTRERVRANVSATTPISYDSGTGVFSHATSGVTAATYANASHVPVVTVNATGHVTGITNTIIGIAASQVTSGSFDAARLPTVGTPGTYGNASHVAVVTTDSYGRVSSVSNTAISIDVGAISSGALSFSRGGTNAVSYTTGTLLTSNGTAIVSLANTGTAGTYANASHVPVITTDAYGRVSGITNTLIAIAASQVTSGAFDAARLPTVGTAGTYANASHIPVITTDAYGRVSSVSNTIVAIAASQVTSGAFDAARLPTVGTAGTYANASHVAVITTDAYGRVSSVSNTLISITSAQHTGVHNFALGGTNASSYTTGALLTSNGTAIVSLANTGTAGVYGNNWHIPVITTDAYGRVSSVSNTAIRTSSTTQTGIVQLEDSITSKSTTNAATANAVNTVYNYVSTSANIQFRSLGVGTAADSTSAGSIRATGEVTAGYSDERLKENIIVIDSALNKVKNIKGVYYNSNDVAVSYGYKKDRKVGVIAQDIESVLPEIVVPAPFDSDGNGNSISGENYKTVQYDKLVPLLIEAIKELSNEIEELKKRQ